jgi:hypothetical protein
MFWDEIVVAAVVAENLKLWSLLLSSVLFLLSKQFKLGSKMGRGNNVDRPYEDRGEGITSTHKRGKATTGGNNVDTFVGNCSHS